MQLISRSRFWSCQIENLVRERTKFIVSFDSFYETLEVLNQNTAKIIVARNLYSLKSGIVK